ncbi:hypothetical protein MS3_00005224 [Schistosoma haematobium]|uniref:Uncharacterized protein n=1 Tax=Schistosoma haematobium TaxID=6185 RepID=A0A922RZJ1_SCHHA|nr:hypothetical protein MS3_00005224 [Schistosoma haematobium]KAH9587512.1 hypothetical protein MS3_00005224 [Schistosoma haematobium]
MWHRPDIRLPTKWRVRSVLFYGCETWSLRVEDIRRLLLSNHRCLRNIARVFWEHGSSNLWTRHRVLGKYDKSVDEVLSLHQLRWLEHVLRMPNYHLPQREKSGVTAD